MPSFSFARARRFVQAFLFVRLFLTVRMRGFVCPHAVRRLSALTKRAKAVIAFALFVSSFCPYFFPETLALRSNAAARHPFETLPKTVSRPREAKNFPSIRSPNIRPAASAASLPSLPGTTPFPFLRRARRANTEGEKRAHKSPLRFTIFQTCKRKAPLAGFFIARLPPKIVINNRFCRADNRS